MKIFFFVWFCFLIACTPRISHPISPGTDPNFRIVSNETGKLKSFNRLVKVFDIPIFAVEKVEDSCLLHAANVMAQYLDNDEDGTADNPAVLAKMLEQHAFMVMWKQESDLNVRPPKGWEGQDLGNDETHPSFVKRGRMGPFDASLEEVLHIITHAGYAQVYPEVFGEKPGTQLGDAMDKARGGQFFDIPSPYPADAWYSYDDETCDYACMATEYHYWALTSLLGAQENRLEEIGQEWKLNTAEKLANRDSAVYTLLTDPKYGFPSILPDGSYRHE